ncbi:hypothetical protein VF21_05380 [Pseudogymnoascus sp. 05NY08]|nr:hypothetical protein VF21_05380 [Pseudogymnoascus sp. 05NY08]
MPARKTPNKPRRNSVGIRKSVSPKRTTPVQDTATPVVNSKIVTCVRQQFIFQIVEVKSKAEAVAAQLAVAL